jgi:hypothetical protein
MRMRIDPLLMADKSFFWDLVPPGLFRSILSEKIQCIHGSDSKAEVTEE